MEDGVDHLFSLHGLVVKDEGNAGPHHLQPASAVKHRATFPYNGCWNKGTTEELLHGKMTTAAKRCEILQIRKLVHLIFTSTFLGNINLTTEVCIAHYKGLKWVIPTGGPAGTTHFFSARAGRGVLLCFAAPSSSIFSTFAASSMGNGTWCTRRWDPSDGRGTFWNAMCGFGFSCSASTSKQCVLTGQTLYMCCIHSATAHKNICPKQHKINITTKKDAVAWRLTFLYSCSESSLMCFCSLAVLTSSSLKLSNSKATSYRQQTNKD